MACQGGWHRAVDRPTEHNAGSEQRQRLQEAAKRRLAARNSRRPRARQNRIGNAAVRRDARALPRVRHSTAWLW
ncbi:hypothetical protein [Streptomyces roseolus]|uniref:hypothetical protein n=1 Tax=Streptomyces roseolus TaxID=67358 RepID=UPI00365A4F10